MVTGMVGTGDNFPPDEGGSLWSLYVGMDVYRRSNATSRSPRKPLARLRRVDCGASTVKARWLPSRLISHRHRTRAELQPAHQVQVDMLR